MRVLTFSLGASLCGLASAGFQVQCFSRLFDERLDPIVNPGSVSKHVHVIAGGNGFAASMDYQQARSSTCLTCNVRDDLSNYWTPKMYFRARNGSFLDVPIQGDSRGGNMGGMVIYYNDDRGDNPKDKIWPFPEGFRMLAGNPFKRAPTSDVAGQAVHMKCLGDGGNKDYPGFPPVPCSGGIRAEIVMPSCWDGVNLDAADHKSHVAYPVGKVQGGKCPESHPKRLFSMFYEVTYRTDAFAGMWDGNTQPFVFSNGDPTGLSFHADFVNGWDVAVLEKASTSCSNTLVVNGNRCQPDYKGADKVLRHMTDQGEALACKLPRALDEAVAGVLPALPGCNPLTTTEESARNVQCDGSQEPPASTAPSPSPSSPPSPSSSLSPSTSTSSSLRSSLVPPTSMPTTLVTSTTRAATSPAATSTPSSTPGSVNGFTYVGCGSDDPASRTFPEKWVALPDMTVEKCTDFCRRNGYHWAGVEWGSECFCGRDLPASRAPKQGSTNKCVKPCNGNAKQICGGDRAMSLYQAA